jgi:hypothetical protein
MDFFVNPWYMVAGGALVSAPIIIHLINRMRFRRVRWAAMEFLLKSQKRNRRRLIIEQLVLLALRCLLVLLAGFLVARFVGATEESGAGTTHVVVLDDTPSMADHWAEKGPTRTAFAVGKEQIQALAKSAAQAPSHQQMRVYLLSDLDTAVYDRRLSDRSGDELHAVLAPIKPAAVHTDPVRAVEKARAVFNDVPQGRKVFHLVSDFRDADWVTGPGVEALNQAVTGLTETGVNVDLLDAAHPYRSPSRQVAPHHDNWAIADFRCETHVAVENADTEFTLDVRNYGASDKPRFLKVFVDGVEDFRATRQLAGIPPGDAREEKFTLNLIKRRGGPLPLATDSREERERKRRLDQEFVHIQAQIEAEETGLAADNVRDLVVEVRRKIPTLVIDGSGPEGRQPGGDFFHLETALESAHQHEIERCTVDDLDRVPLDLYPTLIFLNVAEIRSEKTLQKVRDYVRAGGSVAFFLGDKARPAFYNELFKKYDGLFPLLVEGTPFNAVDPKGTLSEEDRAERRRDRRQNDPQPKILFRDPKHPLVATLAPYASVFRYLGIDVYHRALRPHYRWEQATPAATRAEEIILLPNNGSVDDYKDRAQELGRQALEQTKELAAADKDFARYVDPVERYKRDITQALATPYLYNVVRVLDALLKDRGPEDDPARPDMAVLWAHPKMLPLKENLESFRDTLLYGDPLVVGRGYGKGRVLAVLTSAGTASRWNDWGGGSPASFSYEVFMMDLQRYLTGQGDDLNRTVGEPLRLTFDAAKYLPKVHRRFRPQPEPDAEAKGGLPPEEDQGEQPLVTSGNTLTFELRDARRPGVYSLEFFPSVKEGGAAQTELRSYAFNIDSARESDLRRAGRDKLERPGSGTGEGRVGSVALRAPGDSFDVFKEKRPDASESPWLFLLILVVLVAEQALALHLSFHLRDNEAAAPAAAGGRRVAPRPEPEPEPAVAG